MSGLPYYPRYPRDFFDGTAGMKMELKGPYSLLIDLIMLMGERGLPDDPHFISGHLGCSVRMWNKVRRCLLTGEGCPEGKPKIYAENGIISNTRADKQKIIQRKYRDNQAENASGGNETKGLAKPPHTYREDTDIKVQRVDTDVSTQRARGAPVRRFQEFWDIYPHRGGKKQDRGDCEKLYAAAVKSGVSEQTIIDAASACRSDPQVRRGYGRAAVRWLRKQGWADEVDHNPVTPMPDAAPPRETYADENRRVLGGGPDAVPGDFLDQPNVYQIARAV